MDKFLCKEFNRLGAALVGTAFSQVNFHFCGDIIPSFWHSSAMWTSLKPLLANKLPFLRLKGILFAS
jgi:hypothetical protein